MSAHTLVGPQPRGADGFQKKMWLAASCAGLAVLIGCAAATQSVAWRYHGSPLLGPSIGGVYPPWDVFGWYARWHNLHPEVFEQAGNTGASVAVMSLAVFALASLSLRNRLKVNSTLHGSARWANERDLRRAGLLDNEGVYVGATLKGNELSYLRSSGPEHVMVMAPTGSGKTVGLVIPTLLSWMESVFVLDLKGELWALTAGWRKKHAGNKVLRFEPAAAEGSCSFNPLDEVRVGTQYEVSDAQNIALLIVDPDGQGLKDFWQKSSQSLLTGCLLHLCLKARQGGPPATLPALDALLASPNRPIEDLWTEMVSYLHLNGKTHPVVAAAAQDMLDRKHSPTEAAGITSTCKSYLSLFRDPVVSGNISRSDFQISDLMNNDAPVSLFLITEATDQERLRPLVRILANLVLRRLASGMEFEDGQTKPAYRHKLLLMLDEFVSLGRLTIFEKALAYIRGYGIRSMIIIQDFSQLHAIYGRDESITSNCGILAAFPPAKPETSEYLSRMAGETTIVSEHLTKSGRGFATNVSRAQQQTRRALLMPDEVRTLPGPSKDAQGRITGPGSMLLFATGHPAILATQPLFFRDPVFKARAAVPAPKESDALRAGALPSLALESAMIDL